MVKDWKADRQKSCNVQFCELMASDIREWCEQNKKPETVENFIAYLVKHNVIRQSIINRYMVNRLYPTEIQEQSSKEQAVFALSNKIPLEPRQIYGILKNHSGYFRPNRFKFP